jgi:hypoxanthine phosphoribosyltransferase
MSQAQEPIDSASRIEPIFSAPEIAERVNALAATIGGLQLENLLVVAILKGSFVFAADLIRSLHGAGLAPEVEFITLSSYRKGLQSSGQVAILRDVEGEVRGRNILIVDDILESGRTLAFAKDLLAARGARSVRTCVLVNKSVRRAVAIEADFKAFDCPNVFVVGYGMDAGHRFRELPYVGRLVRE